MTPSRGWAVGLLIFLHLLGGALLFVPRLLTPPAFLDVVISDSVFQSDLTRQQVQVTDASSNSTLTAIAEKVDGGYLVPIGKISSGPGVYRVDVTGYQPGVAQVNAVPMQRVRVGVALVPTFGRLEVSIVNATQARQQVPATLKEGSAVLAGEPQPVITLSLSPGKHRIAADAAGFCPGEREVEVLDRTVTKVQFPLSPDLTGNEVARFVLSWPNSPEDLDSHVRQLGTSGAGNPAHVYFKHMEGRTATGGVFARLDVDQRHPGAYETVTVFAAATGEYEYWVDRYSPDGLLASSGARVDVFTLGCKRQSYEVPPGCAERVWAVAHVRLTPSGVDLIEQQKCEQGQVMQGRKATSTGG